MKGPKSLYSKEARLNLLSGIYIHYFFVLLLGTWVGVQAGSLASIACIAAGLVTRDPNRELDISGIL